MLLRQMSFLCSLLFESEKKREKVIEIVIDGQINKQAHNQTKVHGHTDRLTLCFTSFQAGVVERFSAQIKWAKQ